MNLANYELEHEEPNMTDRHENNNVSCPRKGEDSNLIRFRANRLFSSGSAWYFSTREGKDHGPFLTKEDALKTIEKFISEVSI